MAFYGHKTEKAMRDAAMRATAPNTLFPPEHMDLTVLFREPLPVSKMSNAPPPAIIPPLPKPSAPAPTAPDTVTAISTGHRGSNNDDDAMEIDTDLLDRWDAVEEEVVVVESGRVPLASPPSAPVTLIDVFRQDDILRTLNAPVPEEQALQLRTAILTLAGAYPRQMLGLPDAPGDAERVQAARATCRRLVESDTITARLFPPANHA